MGNEKGGGGGGGGGAVHVTDNNDHECGQTYCNRCSEDVVLYPGYHCVLPKG